MHGSRHAASAPYPATYDWFAGYDGDFDFMVDAVKAIVHNGLYNCHTLFDMHMEWMSFWR